MTILAVQREAPPRGCPEDRLAPEDWRVLDQLLRHGRLALGACDEAHLDRLAAEGLIVRLPAVLITDWGEMRWRQELRRRRRARLTGEPQR